MFKKLSLFIVLVVVWEVVIFFLADQVSDLVTVKYQLAARFSARTSFGLLSIILLWTGVSGLKTIYGNEQNRNNFVLLLLLLSLNHVIHFGYLTINHWANEINILTSRTAGGVFGYLLMVGAPWYLWNKKKLSKRLYWQILGFLSIINLFMLLSYIGRLMKGVSFESPMYVYVGLMSLAAIWQVLNVYRIIVERKIMPAIE